MINLTDSSIPQLRWSPADKARLISQIHYQESCEGLVFGEKSVLVETLPTDIGGEETLHKVVYNTGDFVPFTLFEIPAASRLIYGRNFQLHSYIGEKIRNLTKLKNKDVIGFYVVERNGPTLAPKALAQSLRTFCANADCYPTFFLIIQHFTGDFDDVFIRAYELKKNDSDIQLQVIALAAELPLSVSIMEEKFLAQIHENCIFPMPRVEVEYCIMPNLHDHFETANEFWNQMAGKSRVCWIEDLLQLSDDSLNLNSTAEHKAILTKQSMTVVSTMNANDDDGRISSAAKMISAPESLSVTQLIEKAPQGEDESRSKSFSSNESKKRINCAPGLPNLIKNDTIPSTDDNICYTPKNIFRRPRNGKLSTSHKQKIKSQKSNSEDSDCHYATVQTASPNSDDLDLMTRVAQKAARNRDRAEDN